MNIDRRRSQIVLPAVGIAAYRGTSLFPSRLIQWFTWSQYSHVAIFDMNGPADKQVFQSWHKGGCQWSRNFGALHNEGTPIDLFTFRADFFPSRDQQHRARSFLDTQIGKKYDYAGIVHFLMRHGKDNPARWFCSEIDNRWSRELGTPLCNKPDYRVSPGDCAASAILEKIGSLVVGNGGVDGPIVPV